MKRFILTIGVLWAIYGWALWIITPHRGFQTALMSGMILSPSYLLLAAYRGTAIPMRAFVAAAICILILVGLRIIPGRYDMAWAYILCPPALGLSVALVRYLRRRHHDA